MSRGSLLKAALAGGLLTAFAASLPFLSDFGCCCLFVPLSGVIAAWVLQADAHRQAGLGRCAAAGVLAGALAGAVVVPLAAVVRRLAFGREHLERQLELALEQTEAMGLPQNPIGESFQRSMMGIDIDAVTFLAGAVAALPGAFFGLLGALVVGSILRRPPPPPPAAPPAAPPSQPGEPPAAPTAGAGPVPPAAPPSGPAAQPSESGPLGSLGAPTAPGEPGAAQTQPAAPPAEPPSPPATDVPFEPGPAAGEGTDDSDASEEPSGGPRPNDDGPFGDDSSGDVPSDRLPRFD